MSGKGPDEPDVRKRCQHTGSTKSSHKRFEKEEKSATRIKIPN
jgi:hypothetical protein